MLILICLSFAYVKEKLLDSEIFISQKSRQKTYKDEVVLHIRGLLGFVSCAVCASLLLFITLAL